MKIKIRARTLHAQATTNDDNRILKALIDDNTVVNFVKTNRGTQAQKVFDGIPYHIKDRKIFLHKARFFDLCSGLVFKSSEESLKEHKVKLVFNKDLIARDYQIPIIEKLSKIERNEVLGLTLATGRGKTFSIAKTISNIGLRTFIYVKSEYVLKWVEDVKLYFNLKDDEYYVVQGANSLNRLLLMNKKELQNIKIYIIAAQTFNVYIKNYLNSNVKHTVTPPGFLKHIGASIMLVDEAHEHFENIYKAYAILSPVRAFLLSATLYNVDKRVERYIDEFIPEANRVTDGFVNKHATTIGVRYNLNKSRNFTFKTHMGYSHILFEKSIRRRSALLNSMFDMYKVFLDMYYLKDYKKGDKAVIFFSTIELCKLFIEYISIIYKDKKCSIYTQGFNFDTVLKHDILATTIGKMGSAVDVPDLTAVLQTVVVNSRTKNEQTLGRLRPIPGRDLFYIFFNSVDIEPHTRNFTMRSAILRRVSESLITMKYNKLIG